MNNRSLGIMLLGGALLTAGCGGWRQSVGLEVPPPDEFLVVSREPLQIPPNLEALPPPQPGAPSRVERDPQMSARAALAGGGAVTAGAPSMGEQALLAQVGLADPAIREQLAVEADAGERRFGLDSFFGIPIVQNPDAVGRVLAPVEESGRLRDAGVPAPVAPPSN